MPSLAALQQIAAAKAAAASVAAPPAAVPAVPGAAAPAPEPVDLRTAQQAMKQAADAEAAAAELVMQAGERVAASRQAQTRLDGMATRAVRLLADKLRTRDASPLPAELADARRATFDADQAVAECEGVAQLLRDEHQVAAREAEVARDRLAAAVDARMQAMAKVLVQRMREAEAEAGRLRALALGLMTARPITAPAVGWDVAQLVHEAKHAHMMESAGPGWKDSARVWNAYRDALLTDAGAVGPQ